MKHFSWDYGGRSKFVDAHQRAHCQRCLRKLVRARDGQWGAPMPGVTVGESGLLDLFCLPGTDEEHDVVIIPGPPLAGGADAIEGWLAS